jgi:rubrerythrin
MNSIEDFKKHCLRCGYSWIPRKDVVKECPNCKSPYWNKKRKEISK